MNNKNQITVVKKQINNKILYVYTNIKQNFYITELLSIHYYNVEIKQFQIFFFSKEMKKYVEK